MVGVVSVVVVYIIIIILSGHHNLLITPVHSFAFDRCKHSVRRFVAFDCMWKCGLPLLELVGGASVRGVVCMWW